MTLKNSDTSEFSRRGFVKANLAGALIIPFAGSSCSHSKPLSQTYPGSQAIDCFFVFFPGKKPVFISARSEMGQGASTGLLTIFCEEFEYDPDKVEIKNAHAHSDYANPLYNLQITGGSTSIYGSYTDMRAAGAKAKQKFINAAARKWDVPAQDITADNGMLFYKENGKNLSSSYEDLVEDAVKSGHEGFKIKNPEQFKRIGKYSGRPDAKPKSFGQTIFGIDSLESYNFPASTMQCDIIHCRNPEEVKKNLQAAISQAGENQYADSLQFEIFEFGLVLLADRYWKIKLALKHLDLSWINQKRTPNDALFSEFESQFLKNNDEFIKTNQGQAFVYDYPYQAHAAMEPMNVLIDAQKDSCRAVVPTQSPEVAMALLSEATNLSESKISVEVPFLGGGFGRRLEHDYLMEALQIANKVEKPLQVIWSREEDIKNDYYRPRGKIAFLYKDPKSNNGEESLTCQFLTQSIAHTTAPDMAATLGQKMGLPSLARGLGKIATSFDLAPFASEGLSEFPYEFGEDGDGYDFEYQLVPTDIRVGYWRSVGFSGNGFAIESLLDELAVQQGIDPIQFRLMRAKSIRVKKMLEFIQSSKAWKGTKAEESLSEKKAFGFAVVESFKSVCAQIAEVKESGGKIKITKIDCYLDCGKAIHPDQVKAQCESAIVFGLSAALYGKITYNEKGIEQSNFDGFRVLRNSECPVINTHIMDFGEPIGGVGEPPVPPVAPAVANAIYNLTGKRLRSLPLADHISI